MGVIKSAISDAALTFLWVFNLPTLGILTKISTAFIGIHPTSFPGFFITTLIATLNVTLFSLLGKALGGASFNPATSVSLYAAGLSSPEVSITSMAIRFPAQALAGAGGVVAMLGLMPGEYKGMVRGPALKVGLHAGAVAEGVMTFVLNFVILVIFVKGPRLFLVKIWLLAVATVGMVVIGGGYTGPSLNPANAFGWAFVNDLHDSWEHFYVYWVSPFVGAFAAAIAFGFLFPPRPPTTNKEKKA